VFPELRERFKSLMSGFGDDPISLDLKSAGGISFDAVNVGWYSRNGFPGIYSILSGGMPAWSGEPVSVETALNHSVVWACQRIISETVGFIPAVMMQQKGAEKQVALKHPMYSALHDAPNEEITAMGFSEMLTGHCVLQGNAYAQIVRRSGTGTAIELHHLQPEQVRPDREKDGQRRLIYVVKDGNSPEKTYTVQRGKPHDLLHIRGLGWDGLRGYSVITMARQSIGTAISAERNVARFYANGGRVPYVLKMDKPFKTDADFEKFRADWEKVYAEPHRAPMLENGMDYKQIGLNATDAQLLETRLFHIHEICRWFLVSPHLVGDLSRATFSNIEQLALEFVKMTLSAWLTRWEQELWRCVLTPEEKAQGYFWRHNLNALLRGDFQSRMSGYATMLQNGIASVNEVRDLEDWNPTDGGDDHHIQLNMQTLPGGVPTTSQSAALIRLGSTQ
jgi:HK97 family phage portal protein